MLDEDGLFDDINPIIEGMELTLVDCRLQHLTSGYSCHIILYRQSGLGTDECARVYRTIMPRLEVLLDTQDIHLEVSTPGTDRKIRLPREYQIFQGRGFSVLDRSGATAAGVLTGIDQEHITLTNNQGIVTIPLANITKAKLDYTQEVR